MSIKTSACWHDIVCSTEEPNWNDTMQAQSKYNTIELENSFTANITQQIYN